MTEPEQEWTSLPGWINPADNPDLPWIEQPTAQDLAQLAPPEARLLDEPGWEDFDGAVDTGQQVRLHPKLGGTVQPLDEEDEEASPPRRYVPSAISGINLRDYSRLPSAKGWGAACSIPLATVVLTEARITVHAGIAELVGLIMRANEAQGYRYRKADTGGYNCRKIAGTTSWSNHAWALAVDGNWLTNPYTVTLTTDRPEWERHRWNRYGFAGGWDYSGRKDAMHAEAMGTPAQMQAALILARTELGAPALKFLVIGQIREAYDRVGGLKTLGQPVGPESPTADPKGRWQRFMGGNVYWHPGVDKGTAHVLTGDILKRFVLAGNELAVGWPITDERKTPDGKGRFNHFAVNGVESGSIYWHPTLGARRVYGAIRGVWASQKWETGPLGYPVDEERPAEGGIVQNFQGGSILWKDGKGTIRQK